MPDFQFTITREQEGRRLDQFLGAHLSEHISRTALQKGIKKDGVALNGVVTHQLDVRLSAGDTIVIHIPESKSFELKGEDIPFEVIYEDDYLIIVDKPCGLVVHPGAGNPSGTLVNALIGRNKSLAARGGAMRPGIVHRLDKETSGLLMIAKDNRTHGKLSQMLSSRKIKKEYLAIVMGKMELLEGLIDAPIGRSNKDRTKMSTQDVIFERESQTTYHVRERFRYSTFLSVKPVTGRTHQIRVHLESIGHPVLGDDVYGKHKSTHRLALHAWKLSFSHPITKESMKFEAPIPEDFQKIVEEEKNR